MLKLRKSRPVYHVGHNTKRWANAVLMSAQRLRRWALIKTALAQRLVGV